MNPKPQEHVRNVPSCIHISIPHGAAMFAYEHGVNDWSWSCMPGCTCLATHLGQIVLLPPLLRFLFIRWLPVFFSPPASLRTSLARTHLARRNHRRVATDITNRIGHLVSLMSSFFEEQAPFIPDHLADRFHWRWLRPTHRRLERGVPKRNPRLFPLQLRIPLHSHNQLVHRSLLLPVRLPPRHPVLLVVFVEDRKRLDHCSSMLEELFHVAGLVRRDRRFHRTYVGPSLLGSIEESLAALPGVVVACSVIPFGAGELELLATIILDLGDCFFIPFYSPFSGRQK